MDSARIADSSSETEYLVKDQLLVLRLPDERTYFNLLRILHYSDTHSPLASAFVSSKSRPSAAASPSTTQSTPGSEPPSALLSSPEPTTAATALTSASESSPFPSVKLRKGAQRPSVVDRPSEEAASPDVTHRTLRYDNAHPSLAISVRYPNWREYILRRATHAGRARYALWQGIADPNALEESENEWDGWAYDFQGRQARRLAEEPRAPLVTSPLQSPESASPSKLATDTSRRQNLRPSRVRSEESLRTSDAHTPTPSIAHAPAVQTLRQETEPTPPGKKRKLSISIFIPGVIPGAGSGVTSSASTPRSLGRSRSSSAASALPASMQQRLLQEPKRKASSGNLGFGLNLRLGSQSKSRLVRRPSTVALDHPGDSSEVKSRSSSVPAETVLEITADTASVLSASSPKTPSGSGMSTLAGVKGALRKATARRSIDTVKTSSTSSGSRAGSSLGHTRSRSASTSAADMDVLDGASILLIPTPIVEVARASSPSPSVQLAQSQTSGHGIGKLVRGLSFRK